MENLLSELRTRVARHAHERSVATAVPRIYLGRNCGGTGSMPAFYTPMLCVVLQGAKQVTIGDRSLRYDANSYFLASLDLPAAGAVVDASSQKPFLAMALSIDPRVVASVLPTATYAPDAEASSFGTSPMTPEILEIWLRIVRLLDEPEDIAGLAPLMEQELIYRVLKGPLGAVLRQLARADSKLSRIRDALSEIRSAYDKPISVLALAERAGMSPATFHRHFKAATAMSPLQYQKTLRLHEARTLLLANEEAAKAAYAVGYESASQFSREYSRLFGASPARDLARERATREKATAAKAASGRANVPVPTSDVFPQAIGI